MLRRGSETGSESGRKGGKWNPPRYLLIGVSVAGLTAGAWAYSGWLGADQICGQGCRDDITSLEEDGRMVQHQAVLVRGDVGRLWADARVEAERLRHWLRPAEKSR